MNHTHRQATERSFNIEEAARDGRIMRRVALQNGEIYEAINGLAHNLSAHLRELARNEADSIEWGRALLAVTSAVGALLVDLRKAGAKDDSAILLNMIGWAGLDLLDGVR